MPKKMLIDATHAEETRVVVVDGNKVDEFDYENHAKRQLAGNIYLAKVTRVEPSLQAAFIEYGGNRHGFLAFSEIHPDYYQIPVADREALLAEEEAAARADAEEDDKPKPKPKSRNRRSRSKATKEGSASDADAVIAVDAPEPELVTDLPEDADGDTPASEEDAPAKTAETAAGADDSEAESPTSDDAPDDGDQSDEYEDVGASDVKEEIAPRKPRARRYKIQEVINVRQILLVQVVKEERGNKGAALTTYLSLAGRYCVLMPNTARGGGISRKITNAADRKKLKEIAGSISVPKGAGLIIRTAGAKRTKTEIKRDYEFLLRQWEKIRETTFESVAPSLIYEEGSLIKRSIRDLYSRDIDEIFVEGDGGYREAKDYMKMLMPSHAKNVKSYNEPLPLFSRYQVETTLAGMFNPIVQLKSGGYIVIDVTEALVAVDVNSGRATKERSIEETALKTNAEAAEEVARQARLRDLAGLIVIDFIDMEERKNNAAVEKRLKDKLKTDRARIQVGRISGFGLLEMSRQRLRPGILEATTAPCPHCHGTGRVRSDDNLALAIMRELEDEGVRRRSREVLVTAPVEIANYMLNQKREHVAMIETRFGLSVRIEGDHSLISPDYRVERFKTATRIVPMPEGAPIEIPEIEADEPSEEAHVQSTDETGDQQPKKRRRRRRRRGGRGGDNARREDGEQSAENGEAPAEVAQAEPEAETATQTDAEPATAKEDAPKKTGGRTSSRRRSRSKPKDDAQANAPDTANADAPATKAPAPKKEPVTAEVASPEPVAAPDDKPAPKKRARASAKATIEDAKDAPEEVEPDDKDDTGGDDGKRRGWWSRAIGG